MEYEALNDRKLWRINTWDYKNNYKRYINESKAVMGLGADLDLKEFINSNKEVVHRDKSYIKTFLSIDKGDYLEWIVYDRKDIENGESYLEVNRVIGEVTKTLSEGYEFIKDIGHTIPIQIIDKSTVSRYGVDYFTLYKLENLDINNVNYFKNLDGYEELEKSQKDKWYLRLSYFGIESLKFSDKQVRIEFQGFSSQEEKGNFLSKLKQLKKEDYVLGHAISKHGEEFEVINVMGTVQELKLEQNAELVLDIINQLKNKISWSAAIGINEVDEEESTNFIYNKLIKNKNIILCGPPGTGKTYGVTDQVIKIINPYMLTNGGSDREDIVKEVKKLQNNNRIKFCTFHQSYGYEEFVEGLRSDKKGNFICEDGALKEIAIEALFEGLLYEYKAEVLNEKAPKKSKKDLVLEHINDNDKFCFYDCDQYVIVIDEINRGNISKIFGELITLLEEDKRLTKENETIVKLPYSKEDFVLPPNLHLIGTMNTSDKSVAPIDIALRRRFKFVEIMPNEELLKTVDGIDLKQMLKKMNDRIEYLYDREHMIGHAYFIKLNSIEEIVDTFRNKIIPLLQEYFYEDWNNIGLVLGGVGTSNTDKYIIYKKEINPVNLFKDASTEDFRAMTKYYIKNIIGQQELKNIYE